LLSSQNILCSFYGFKCFIYSSCTNCKADTVLKKRKIEDYSITTILLLIYNFKLWIIVIINDTWRLIVQYYTNNWPLRKCSLRLTWLLLKIRLFNQFNLSKWYFHDKINRVSRFIILSTRSKCFIYWGK